jgi:hypothetical protein
MYIISTVLSSAVHYNWESYNIYNELEIIDRWKIKLILDPSDEIYIGMQINAISMHESYIYVHACMHDQHTHAYTECKI